MSEFTCTKCTTKVKTSPGEVGCPACGFGRPHVHEAPAREERARPSEPQQVEAPPGYSGKYLTEAR
jgi:uncharacterized Zn finger protein (UPF0148 family)